MTFNTDSFRDLTFGLLSGIADDTTKFDELNEVYLKTLHERNDLDEMKKYTKDIYDKLLSLQIVQANSNVQLKDCFHERIIILYVWTFSDIHSAHMMQKIIGIDKRYSSAGVRTNR